MNGATTARVGAGNSPVKVLLAPLRDIMAATSPGDHVLIYVLGTPSLPSVVHSLSHATLGTFAADSNHDTVLAIVVSAQWVAIELGYYLQRSSGTYHLTAELREIVLAIRRRHPAGSAQSFYREAKGAELLCDTAAALRERSLVAATPTSTLSRDDTLRVFAAKEVIDGRWHEKLTIDSIARLSGIGRCKLTTGFREVFGTSVAHALAERRFYEAKRRLRTSDAHVGTIAYAVGYENNASFTRAFARRFGIGPAQYRATSAALLLPGGARLSPGPDSLGNGTTQGVCHR
ncbi:MAG: AraC family transcriptional regulator [Pseudomonadota bacterium]